MSRVAPHGHAEDAPASTIVDLRKSTFRRRSSMSIAPPAVTETASTPKPPQLVAGDQLVRPHFLKDRSMTMHERVGSTSLQMTATSHQSKASTFLARLLEASRATSPAYDGKSVPASNQQATSSSSTTMTTTTSATNRSQEEESDVPPVPQRRRPSIIISGSHLSKGIQLQHVNTIPLLLSGSRPRLQSVGSGTDCLATHEEDEPDEYITEMELQDRPLTQLVQDLSLYKKRSGTLLRILKQILRRLRDAEGVTTAGQSSHIGLCEDLVDDGILAGVVLVLREFRFHVALQIAAVALLSFIANVSDLYAYMMAELDVEPLVQKIAAVHVYQERLVMNGSSLIHTISESKHKSHVVKMHKARLMEREKKRAASFVEAFVAQRKNSRARVVDGSERRCGTPTSRGDPHRAEQHRPSRWQRSELGAPPALTPHYDLKISLSRPRSSLLSPLDRRVGGDDEEMFSEIQWRRPKTSPDPRRLTGQFSATKLTAVYLTSPAFVAPSPMGQRTKIIRSTHSAMVSTQKMSKRRGTVGVAAIRDYRGALKTTSTDDKAGSVSGVYITSLVVSHNERVTCDQASSQEIDGGFIKAYQAHGGEGSEEDANYDNDGFAANEEDGDGTNEEGEVTHQDRLLPVGSDSDLFDLVDLSAAELAVQQEIDQACSSRHENVQAQSPPSIDQICSVDACAECDCSTCSPALGTDEARELVAILGRCVNPQDPAESLKAAEDSLARAIKSASSRPKKSSSRSSQALWTSANAIVRPVSKRIINKAVKANRRQRVSCFSSEKTCELPQDTEIVLATAQITTVLDKSRYPRVETVARAGSGGPDSISTKSVLGFLDSHSAPLTPTTSVARIQALYARGLQHQRANELDAAIRCYEEGIHLQHSSGVQREFASLYINLGSARIAQQRPYDALAAFAQAERIQPSNVKAKFNSGLVLMQLAQWEEASTKFAQVVAADPSHVRAQFGLEQCRKAVVQP